MTGILLSGAVSIAGAQAKTVPLPDTEITRAGIYSARLISPTRRYGHAVLGDAIEAGGFSITVRGRTLSYHLGDDAVFEDRRVRLADIDGDGVPEAIVIKSYLTRGAAIALYRIGTDAIAPLAESDAIGTPNRWLNILGSGDLSGAGTPLIAAIVTPHLSGSLRIYRLEGARLVEIARQNGSTNHIIGMRDLDLGRLHDVNGDGVPDILVPTLDRKALAAVSYLGGSLNTLFSLPVAGRIRTLAAPDDRGVSISTDEGKTLRLDFPRD